MKLVVIGDLHLHERSPRYRHTLDLLDWIIDDVADQAQGERVAWALLGDLVEGTPSGTVLTALMDWMSRAPGAKYLVLGNHESPDALRPFGYVPDVAAVAWDRIIVEDLLPGADLMLVPYPRRGRPPFDQLEDDGTIRGAMTAAAARIADEIFAADQVALVRAQAAGGRPKPLIVLGHVTVEGMTTRDAEFELHGAAEVVVPQAAFDGVALAAFGHIHRAQDVAPHIVGVGSLARQSFAEAGDDKSYTLVAIDPDGVTWTRRAVPARTMTTCSVRWPDDIREDPTALATIAGGVVGQEVKITVEIPEDQLATFDASVFDPIQQAAALFVLDRETVAVERTRAPEIAAAETPDDQLVAWLTATEQAIGTADYERLSTKLAEVAR